MFDNFVKLSINQLSITVVFFQIEIDLLSLFNFFDI